MKNKYSVQSFQLNSPGNSSGGDVAAKLLKDGIAIAVFSGDYPNNYTNAQKACDLLNEASRSQGVYPK